MASEEKEYIVYVRSGYVIYCMVEKARGPREAVFAVAHGQTFALLSENPVFHVIEVAEMERFRVTAEDPKVIDA